MKTKITLFFTILLSFACQKDDDAKPIDDEIVTVSDNELLITLPENYPIAIENLQFKTPFETIDLVSTKVKTSSNSDGFYTSFVSEGNSVILMGYHYPGLTNKTINTESTALALIMGLVANLNLNTDLKKQVIQVVQQNPDFPLLATKMESKLSQGGSSVALNDPDFVAGISAIYLDLFDANSPAGKSLKRILSDPVEIRAINNEVTFVNPGNSFSSVVGIYRDGEAVAPAKLLKGVNYFPTNLTSAFGSLPGATYASDLSVSLDVIEETITLTETGEYTFKVRTGSQKDIDALLNDSEAREAWLENAKTWMLTILFDILPLEDFNASQRLECFQAIGSEILEFLGNIDTFGNTQHPVEFLGLLFSTMGEFLNASFAVVAQCLGVDGGYGQQLEQLTDMLRYISIAGNLGNLGVGIYQWYIGRLSRMDECYTFNGSVLEKCEVDQRQIFRNILETATVSLRIEESEQSSSAYNNDGDELASAYYDDEGYMTELTIERVGIASFHPSISQLTKLEQLVSRGNPIIAFPGGLNAPATLKTISIGHYCKYEDYTFPLIADLPTNLILEHVNLENLYISGQVNSVSPDLAYHPSLTRFGIGNMSSPVSIPVEICEAGIQAQSSYFRPRTAIGNTVRADCELANIEFQECNQ